MASNAGSDRRIHLLKSSNAGQIGAPFITVLNQLYGGDIDTSLSYDNNADRVYIGHDVLVTKDVSLSGQQLESFDPI